MIITDLHSLVLIERYALKDFSDALGVIGYVDFQAHPEVKARVAIGLSQIF